MAVVVAAIVAFVVTDSDTVRAVALVLEAVITVGLIAYLYRLLTRTLGAAAPPPAEPSMPLGAEVSGERLHSVIVIALRDAHALQRGVGHFTEAALDGLDASGVGAGEVYEILERQRAAAADDEGRISERLAGLGQARGRLADDELLVGEWMYERLLAHNVLTNARHAFGLAHLAATTYAMLERLAATAGDEETRRLAAGGRAGAETLAADWAGAWDAVLDAAEADGAGRNATHELLGEAEGMEQMRTRLLTVTAGQSRQAGIASGADEAGLGRLVEGIDQERAEVDEHLRLLRGRLQELGERPSRVRGWETFAAARTAAMSQHVRGYKLARDVRDVIASDELEVATYELLKRAAERDGDTLTAELASRLRDHATEGAFRGAEGLDEALEIALLAE
ncbi:MAG: hypothetical protein ACSLFR_03445 [Solirubrobacteraceae bacterium]